MTCDKCGGLMAYISVGDWYECHEAAKCLHCGRIVWLAPVPYASPEITDWQAEEAARAR